MTQCLGPSPRAIANRTRHQTWPSTSRTHPSFAEENRQGLAAVVLRDDGRGIQHPDTHVVHVDWAEILSPATTIPRMSAISSTGQRGTPALRAAPVDTYLHGRFPGSM